MAVKKDVSLSKEKLMDRRTFLIGFVENMRTSWSQASAASIGSWSTKKYLPMARVDLSPH